MFVPEGVFFYLLLKYFSTGLITWLYFHNNNSSWKQKQRALFIESYWNFKWKLLSVLCTSMHSNKLKFLANIVDSTSVFRIKLNFEMNVEFCFHVLLFLLKKQVIFSCVLCRLSEWKHFNRIGIIKVDICEPPCGILIFFCVHSRDYLR